ncbi:MAG: esterase [Pseudohongiellaceae bacterium]|jgi:esterase
MREQSITLYAEAFGQGQDVLLLHGLFGMGSNLKGVARALEADFRVHCLDLRNHGLSPHTADMSYPLMAGDVYRYMQRQGIESCHVLGHSMGGKVAMQLALQYPECVDRLVVADISPVAYQANHDNVFAGLLAVDFEQVVNRKDVEKVLKHHVEEPAVIQFLLRNLYRDYSGRYSWRMNVAALDQCYNNIKACLNSDHVFEGAVLFLKGEHSDYILPAHKEAILQLFPKADLKVVQNTGHWLHAEKPTVFNQQVVRFFKGV